KLSSCAALEMTAFDSGVAAIVEPHERHRAGEADAGGHAPCLHRGMPPRVGEEHSRSERLARLLLGDVDWRERLSYGPRRAPAARLISSAPPSRVEQPDRCSS